MAANPLLAAMVGGGNEGSMLGMDPNVMAAAPQLQLAQSLMGQGTSTAPAYPMQALARALMAPLGASIQQGAMSDLAGAYSSSASELGKIFPPGTKIGDMLASNNPMVRMQGMQLASKAAILNEQARYEGGGEPTVNTPQGPTKTPITAAQRAAMSDNPTAAIQPPPNLSSEPQIAGANTAATKAAENRAEYGPLLNSGAVPGPPVPNKPQDRVPASPGPVPNKPQDRVGAPGSPVAPATDAPIKSANGTLIPSVQEQAPIPNSPAQLKIALPQWQETVTNWNKSIAPSQQAEQRLTTIANAFKQIETGSFQTNKAQIGAALKSIGVPEETIGSILTDPSKVQLALHENYVETLDQLKAATPRFSQMEFKVLSQNKEHPDLQPAANLQMLAEDIGTLRQARDLPSDFTAARKMNWQDPQSFEQAWMKANPLSGYVAKVKKEIGPLKGMAGATEGPTKPGAYVWTPNGLVPK